jgi:cytoskeletal protein CcmA (bactofilin family)
VSVSEVAERTSFLGAGSFFEGKLSFAETVHIDGHFRGDVRADGVLVVGETGIVEATVAVRRLVVRGAVIGQVSAKEGVRIEASGRVEGRVTTPRIAIADGGQLNAQLDMGESSLAG